MCLPCHPIGRQENSLNGNSQAIIFPHQQARTMIILPNGRQCRASTAASNAGENHSQQRPTLRAPTKGAKTELAPPEEGKEQ